MKPLATTTLTWLPPSASAELEPGDTVLIVIELDGHREWTEAWFDPTLQLWVLCESGGNVDGEVLAFARVDLPSLP